MTPKFRVDQPVRFEGGDIGLVTKIDIDAHGRFYKVHRAYYGPLRFEEQWYREDELTVAFPPGAEDE